VTQAARSLLAISNRLIDGATHDAGIGEFGVAEFAGLMDIVP
jgi:hypothetical protein